MTVQVIETNVAAATNYSIYRMWGFNELFDIGKLKIQVRAHSHSLTYSLLLTHSLVTGNCVECG